MGFNTYNDVACTLNQSYVQNTINAFSSKGFGDLGYKYFQIDCGWQGRQRQSNGSITYDASVFPDGITPLSKLAISKGFQWSMYTDQGIYACDTAKELRPGSLNYEKQDALMFAAWNTAYVKIDNCYVDGGSSEQNAPKDPRTDFPSRYQVISSAIQDVGIKGILICQWGTPYQSPSGLQGPSAWTPSLSNSNRVSDDIIQGWANVMRIMNEAIHVNLRGLSGPSHFADMDLLEVGNPGMTVDEQASHFAIWAYFKSALMVSTAIPTMSTATQNILQNKDLIAINQDSLGEPVKLVQRFTDDSDVYAGCLANGDRAVLLLDQSNQTRSLAINFPDLGIASATVKNLWTGRTRTGQTSYTAQVNAHGSLPLRLSDIQTVPVPAPKLTWIEAESGTLAGGANIQFCSGCSGSSKAGNISAEGGSLTLSGIRTSQATQDVRFDYIDCEIGYLADQGTNVRGASISVNGGPGQNVLFPLTGYNWDRDVTRNHLVRLSGFSTSGINTIKISGLSGSSTYAPDFDRIGVVA
ncbi:glycoside hydrolase family 27 carbohydrate-binding module family 35 protein [Pseudocercospora fijiensis CIRAD86]|uniref:Alpha-galactosidase n=1 Tax=Pseudocercospora fijiensis (strain CIRAD86) TaxID=383855 RepID=N1Q7U1_PSEFD|nr:glycoside hydrolase family 27 carbohydrate-binding module family 35 protein [Pseudocercospora fijiensis CIRAD86]EME88829.1 glycoside hydrolase family 27 carbohydrate-binding module family 35 protein [Pseudocercospora fijiensis CIRAD86]